MEKLHYTYELFISDTKALIDKCKGFEPDVILAVARGGLTLSHFMAQTMNIRNLFSLNSIHYNNETKLDTFEIFNIPDLSNVKKVLIVDDIVDSGETMVEILKILNKKFPNTKFKIATLFYKKSALIQPDFSVKEANCWIDFFWEADI